MTQESSQLSPQVPWMGLFPVFPEGRRAEETSAPERTPPLYIVTDIIRDAEIVELRERIRHLEEKERQSLVPVQFLESERLTLVQPLVVSLGYDSEAGMYFVDCLELSLYGQGQDEQEAMQDFKIAIEELYFSLREDEQNLGPALKIQWDILKKLLQEL